MNLKLAELIASVPSEYIETNRTHRSATFTYKNKEIYIVWYHNRQPYSISYEENGKHHRPSAEGPAFQSWYDNGQLWEISYWENGKEHRPHTEGPALQYWYQNGQLVTSSYLENGKEVKTGLDGKPIITTIYS